MENANTLTQYKSYRAQTKRYCQTLKLINDPELIEEYKFWHKPENRWPEIPAGIREVGILDMEIYISDNLLFMIVETSVDFDWQVSFDRLATLHRQAEWEAFMGRFQLTSPDMSSSEKWKLMDRIFSL